MIRFNVLYLISRSNIFDAASFGAFGCGWHFWHCSSRSILDRG
jgi:hypothetical protein